MNPKPKSFPVVTEECCVAAGSSMMNDPDGNFNEKILALIDEENPVLGKMMVDFANKAIKETNPEDAIPIWLSCICSTYVLLRNQAEADEMNEDLS